MLAVYAMYVMFGVVVDVVAVEYIDHEDDDVIGVVCAINDTVVDAMVLMIVIVGAAVNT